MLETSQSLLRAMALTALTAVFAGMWNNDRPTDPTLAVRLPADQRSYVLQHVSTAPVFKRLGEHQMASTSSRRIPYQSSFNTLDIGTTLSRTISVETDDLLITRAELAKHINKLPLGIAAGDYRIVDSLGGVGWLHVRDGQAASQVSTESEMMTTEIGDSIVRFLPVRHNRLATLQQLRVH